MKKSGIWFSILIMAIFGLLFSILALAMIASLSGDPSYAPERAHLNVMVWGTIAAFCLVTIGVSAVNWRRAKKLDVTNSD